MSEITTTLTRIPIFRYLDSIASVSVSFLPTSIGSIFWWYDASDTATITSDAAGSVSQWNDKSGNNYHATQAIASAQPITGVSVINSKNGLFTNSNTQHMLVPTTASTITLGNYTVIAVGQKQASALEVMFGFRAGVTNRALAFTNTSDSVFSVRSNTSTGTVTMNANTTAGTTFIGGYVVSASTITPFVNGVFGTPGTNAQVINTIDGISLMNGGDNTAGFTGMYLETVCYTSALTSSALNQLGQYLGTKWGVTWTSIS